MQRLLTLFLFVCFLPQVHAQSICDDDQCSDELANIRLDEPRDPAGGTYTAARLAAFTDAYDRFAAVQRAQRADAGWQASYNTSQLGGRKCLLYYDLESRLAYEYDKHPAFRSYVDGTGGGGADFRRSGFESSRRGMNLQTRLERECPGQVRKSEKDGTSELTDRKRTYQHLGVVQGYWDEAGNTLKPLEVLPTAPASAPATARGSKKQQVADLTQTVQDLAAGIPGQDKIDDLAAQVGALAPAATDLLDQLTSANDKLDALRPRAGGLVDRVAKLPGLKEPLSDFMPKISGSGIVDKIKGWFGKGKKLRDEARQVAERADRTRRDLQDVIGKARRTAAEVDQQAQDVADLSEQRRALAERQDELRAKLDDKPKKILDQLHREVADAKAQARAIADQIAAGNTNHDELKKRLAALNDRRGALEDKIDDIGRQFGQLTTAEEDLRAEGNRLKQRADQLDKQADLQQRVADLPAAGAAGPCAEELARLLAGLEQVTEKKEKRKFSLGRLLSAPARLLQKVTGFIDRHSGLKAVLSAIPGVSNVVNLVDGLFGKSKALAGVLNTISDKQTAVSRRLDDVAQRIDGARRFYDDKVQQVRKLTDAAASFTTERSALAQLLAKPLDDLTDAEARVIDLVRRGQTLAGGPLPCADVEPQNEEVAAIDEELETLENDITELEEELAAAEEETEQIGEQTAAVEEEVAELRERDEELRREEEAIRQDLGEDVRLEPVTLEQYAESFEIERPYWEATFHPDDEVVEGYRGRYFQVQLRDADQAVKLLFGPGEYFMSKTDFRDQYGSVIGAFVTEALAAIKKSDRAGVKLFVQGSADISGAGSFRGDLDESFYYDEVTLLPLRGSENFGGDQQSRTVPERGFTNDDLPNLRGRYMQEMIGFYSKKLQPILLEGSVKEKVDREDRNATIYLFLPEALLDR